jgi:biotin synthase
MDEVGRRQRRSASGIHDLLINDTAEFSQEPVFEYGRAVRAVLPRDMRLVAMSAILISTNRGRSIRGL